MKFNQKDIKALDSRYRAQLINSLTGFKAVVLCGTKSNEGLSNLAILSSTVHLGSNPPLYGLVFRPDTVQRDTLNNIRETKKFTLNHISEGFVAQAHQTSARYSAQTSEFEATGLSEMYIHGFHAPFVEESSIQLGLHFVREIPIQENGTSLVIGEIHHIHLNGDFLAEDGFVDINSAGTITLAGLDAYHSSKKIARLTYAKPEVDIAFSEDFSKAPETR